MLIKGRYTAIPAHVTSHSIPVYAILCFLAYLYKERQLGQHASLNKKKDSRRRDKVCSKAMHRISSSV